MPTSNTTEISFYNGITETLINHNLKKNFNSKCLYERFKKKSF